MSKIKTRIEYSLAVILFVSAICVNLFYINKFDNISKSASLNALDSKRQDIQMKAIDHVFSKISNTGQTAIVLIGVLWAILMSKESNINLATHARMLMFWAANLWLGSSYFAYYYSSDKWASLMFANKTLDLEAPEFGFWMEVQAVNLTWGLVSVAIVILVGRSKF